MSEHRATISWSLGSAEFEYPSYSRNHAWTFAEDVRIEASATPEFLGDSGRIDPEEAFVASIASCHMLTFLALAANKRLELQRYTDSAVGYLEKNAEGKLAITRVVLRPRLVFGGSTNPGTEELERLHELAHAHCFIANSIRTHVSVELE